MRIDTLRHCAAALIVGMLAACSGGVRAPAPGPDPTLPRPAVVDAPAAAVPGGTVLAQPKSRWVAVPWSELPGLDADPLYEAWNAWIRSCERPVAPFVVLCAEVRQMSIADDAAQRSWLLARLQPYRVETPEGQTSGLLTGYYEPVIAAQRLPGNGYAVPIYRTPATLGTRKPWYTRQQIDTLPDAQAALRGRAIAWVADPVEAMVLHIQGSGRLRVAEPDGTERMVRVAYAGTNDQPYGSIGRWLLDQGLVRDASWPGIRAWIAANPQRTSELLWSNPRYVFFREEPLDALSAGFGPRGAHGVALTPGRSIAVDRQSIPYGTPVWLASSGPQTTLARLVLAQDTGSAIVGAVRADYFAGWGAEAGELAGRLKQPLRMWVLWPK